MGVVWIIRFFSEKLIFLQEARRWALIGAFVLLEGVSGAIAQNSSASLQQNLFNEVLLTTPASMGIFTMSFPSRLPTLQEPTTPPVQTFRAGLVEKLSLKDLTTRATTILIGTVAHIKCIWNDKRTNIFTYVTISVEQYIKGTEKEKMLTLKVSGGKIGEVNQWVEDTPHFQKDEKVLLFLEQEHFRVVGGLQGKYSIEQEKVVGLDIPVDDLIHQIRNLIKKTSSEIPKKQKPEKSKKLE
jgi:hypothetical protein